MCQEVAVMYAGQIVERTDVRRLFRSPQMPYTQALLSSIPKFGMTQTQKLATIRGVVPSPLSWPRGCRFAPRCDYRFDKCDAPPPLFDVGEQAVACWLCEAGRRETAPTLPSPASGGGD
jgi:peptide/nickel transport system ATP-binding protein